MIQNSTKMGNSIISSNDLIEFNKKLNFIKLMIQTAIKHHSSLIGGERYLTTKQVCSLLDMNSRTLQVYRDKNRIGYVQLSRKILYKESDIVKVLQENYVPRITL